MMASEMRMFDGAAKNDKIFEAAKNMRVQSFLLHESCPNRIHFIIALLAPRGVARLGLIVGRIEAGQLDAFLHFA